MAGAALFTDADSKVIILPGFGPISKPNDHADDNCLCLNAQSDPFPLARVRERLPTTRRSSNRLFG